MEIWKNKSYNSLPNEVWKRIDDEVFWVSNLGRVKNTLTKKIVGQSFGRKKYLKVNKVSYSILVHRLVLHCFSPLSEFIGAQGNHKNGIKTDNRLENLEWVTGQDNVIHAFKIGLRKAYGENNNFSKLSSHDVKWIRDNYVPGKFGQKKEFSKKFNVSPSTIKNIYLNKAWKHI